MKNIFRLDTSDEIMSKVKKYTIAIICIYIICMIDFIALFIIDTDEKNLAPLVQFMDNEHKYFYNDKYYPLQFKDSANYMHSIGFDYIGTRVNAQWSEVCDVITDMESTLQRNVDSMDSAKEFVNNLIPDSTSQANDYVKLFIHKYAYYDLLAVIDPECEDYWEISSYAWQNIVFSTGYKNAGYYAFLYEHLSDIVLCHVLIMIVTFSLGIGYLVVYFCRVYKMKGADQNEIHGET